MTQSSTPDYARAKTVGLADIPVIDLAGTDSPAGRAAVAAALVKATLESVGLQLDVSQVVMAECTPWENGPTGPRQRGQGPAVEVV